MLVNADTKIAALLKHHPQALDSIISISPRFEKLRNPLLRKLMAGRTSIGMAAKIGGCSEADFYRVLQPLGFIADKPMPKKTAAPVPLRPALLQALQPRQLLQLDVRPLLAGGEDPLKLILATIKSLQEEEVLKIINTFEPSPLIALLKQRGWASWTDCPAPGHFETYFFRESDADTEKIEAPAPLPPASEGDWEALEGRFAGNMVPLDVRALEMPGPMIRILETLEGLAPELALYVVHKRLPLFLLPELAQRGYTYRSRELSENEVHLLIFRNEHDADRK
jgi:hypothetical protein